MANDVHMMTTTPTDLVGVDYVATVLDVDRATITRRLAASPFLFAPEPVGKMPGANGAYVWRRADVDAWAASLDEEDPDTLGRSVPLVDPEHEVSA